MSSTTEQQAAAFIKANPRAGRNKIVGMFHISERIARRMLREAKGGGVPQPSAVEPSAPAIKVRGMTEFRKAHDIPQKIRDQIKRLRGGYVTEDELRQLCEVSLQNWRRNADLPEFNVCKLKIDGQVYWSDADTIREMKQITGKA